MAVATAGIAAGAASAQQPPERGLFERDRNVSVRERARPEFESVGVPLGAFRLFPVLNQGVRFDDNIFATDSDKQSSVVYTASPELRLESNWSRHSFTALAQLEYEDFLENSEEDHLDSYVGADGRLDFARNTELGGGASYQRETEPRTSSSSPLIAEEPIRYDLGGVYGTFATQFNRLRFSSRLDWRTYDFDDGRTPAGAVVDQDDRDRDRFDASARFDYAVSPATSLFGEASYNERSYDLQPPETLISRNSDGVEILFGANFDLSSVARGEIAVGWFEQDFDDAAFGDADGFDVRAGVEWFPTQLTTVEFTASRGVEDSGIIGSPAYIATGAEIRVDHELLRNLILSAGVGYADDDYEGIDREDERVSVTLDATWLVNRNVGIRPYYSYIDQTSSGTAPGQDFEINRIGVRLRLMR